MALAEQRLRRLADANGGHLSITIQDLLDEFELSALTVEVVEAIEELLESTGLSVSPPLKRAGIADLVTLSRDSSALEDDADPTRDFDYWIQRSVALAGLQTDARSHLQRAGQRCEASGISKAQLKNQAKEAAAPAAAAGGGGLAFAYFESGPDSDMDGDVDGGLFDALGDLF